MARDDELKQVPAETEKADDWANDTEWEEWSDEDEGTSRRLGRAIPGWVPLLVVAALVIFIGFRWGFSGRATPRATPTTQTSPGISQTAPPQATPQPGVTPPPATVGVANATVPPASTGQSSALPVAVGRKAVVTGAGTEGISLRFGGGLDYARLAVLTDGTPLTVLEPPSDLGVPYPVQNNGFTWWRVQMQDGTVGWVAENWLQVTE